jgi:hypothetical protein
LNLLYLIGQPGAGKSTLVELLTAGLGSETYLRPFQRVVYETAPGVVELGGRRDSFSGTDVLALNAQPTVLDWLTSAHVPLVLGEGDRLANDKFFTGCAAAGYELHIVWLAPSHDVAAARRLERAAALGVRPQNEAWVKGRISKSGKLASKWSAVGAPHRFSALDADKCPAEILDAMLATGDPVATKLRSAA